jgi:hypothetical protein
MLVRTHQIAAMAADPISPPVISAAANPAKMDCFIARSFASLQAWTLLVGWAAFAAFDGSVPSRPAVVTKPR